MTERERPEAGALLIPSRGTVPRFGQQRPAARPRFQGVLPFEGPPTTVLPQRDAGQLEERLDLSLRVGQGETRAWWTWGSEDAAASGTRVHADRVQERLHHIAALLRNPDQVRDLRRRFGGSDRDPSVEVEGTALDGPGQGRALDVEARGHVEVDVVESQLEDLPEPGDLGQQSERDRRREVGEGRRCRVVTVEPGAFVAGDLVAGAYAGLAATMRASASFRMFRPAHASTSSWRSRFWVSCRPGASWLIVSPSGPLQATSGAVLLLSGPAAAPVSCETRASGRGSRGRPR
jgi:hypothetical protein